MNGAGARLHPVNVVTTQRRGLTPEELAEMALDKIVHVSSTAPPAIREQAEAFRRQIRGVLVHYLRQAAASDRTTVYNALIEAGRPDLAESIRRL